MNYKVLLYIVSAFMLFYSCSNKECGGYGDTTITKEIAIDSFSKLTCNGIFYITVIPDTINKLEITAESNIANAIEVINDNGNLQCSYTNPCVISNKYDQININLHTTSLDSIIINKACKIVSHKPIQRNLYIETNADMCDMHLQMQNNQTTIRSMYKSTGNIVLEGSSKKCDVTINYLLAYNSPNLLVEDYVIEHNAISDMYVSASNTLQASISKTGMIWYTNNPVVIDVKNSGNIRSN